MSSAGVPVARTFPSSMATIQSHLLRLVHVRGGDATLMLGRRAANVVDQRPELAPRKRIDARGGLVEDEEIRIVDKCAAEPHFLLHAPREFPGGPIGERAQSSGLEQLLHAARTLAAAKDRRAAP